MTNRSITFVMAIALVVVTMAKASAISSRAQLDPGDFVVLQNGVQVGEVYVPKRDPRATHYVEHWVLYNGYVYLDKDHSGLTTEIRVARKSSYQSEADFFARAPFGPGSRYVRIDCTEANRLPGR